MAHTPKHIDTIMAAVPKPLLQKLTAAGATGIQLSGSGTVRLDMPDRKDALGNTVNRVRIVARPDGTVDIQLMQVITHETLEAVATGNVANALNAALGLEL